MENKRFKKNDSGFVCESCGETVAPLGYTSRNHCPRCLYSKHVDLNPGDRANGCGGLMRPVFAELSAKKGFVLHFVCEACGEKKKNAAARGDNRDLLIELSVSPDLF